MAINSAAPHVGKGNDIIVGGSGSDKLFGGSGSDAFVLSDMQSGDLDIIADFGSGDEIDWSWFMFESHDELMSFASQQGSHVLFGFDDYAVRLNNVDLESIESDSFIL